MDKSSDSDAKLRRRRHALLALAAAIAALLLAGKLCLFTVATGEHALVTEFGKPVRVIQVPGLAFKLPYESVRSFDTRLFVYTPTSNEFLTLEKTPVVAAGTVHWRIADATRFFQTVFDKAGAESRLADVLFSELGAAIGRTPLAAFFSVEPQAYQANAIIDEVARRCRELAARDYGIEVVGIHLQRFDFPEQNRARVYARMASERGRMSMQYRSEGDEEGTKVRAVAEQERTRILSEALKLAQQQRAQGEGEAARIYAGALGKAPAFYEFLRAMEASRSLVPKASTLVLPADSELFGLLYDSRHYEGARQRSAQTGRGRR